MELGRRLPRKGIYKQLLRLQRVADKQQRTQLKAFYKQSVQSDENRILDTSIPHAFRQISAGRLNPHSTLHTKCTTSGRPHQVWVYDHCNNDNTLIFEEKNSSCTVDVALTRNEKYVTINSNSRTSSEVHILKSHDLLTTPTLARPRQSGVEYYIDHAHGRFYVFTNEGDDMEYKVMTANDDNVQSWRDFYSPKGGFILKDIELFANHIVLFGLRDLVPVAMVMDAHNRDKEPVVMCFEEACHMDKASPTQAFDSSQFAVWFSSPVVPPSLCLCRCGEITTFNTARSSSKQTPTVERVHTISKDGTAVPITLLYRKSCVRRDSHNNPLLVNVYGCYGEDLPMGYQPEMQYLIERGWVLAYCHVRGGGEKGRRWYHNGRGRKKRNSFEDLHSCVQHLHTTLSLSQPHLTVMTGRSAGAHSVGMFCNLWPHLIQAAILQVPFVNVMDSLLDPSLYLSQKDYEEFGGNPRESEEERRAVSSVCPYSTLTPQDYPAMYISASTLDEIIPFEGVQKYVAKLKHCVQTHRKNLHKNRDLNRHSVGGTHTHEQGGNGSHNDSIANKMRRLFFRSKLSSETVSRGSVVFRVDEKNGHFGSDRVEDNLGEAALRIDFMNNVIRTKH